MKGQDRSSLGSPALWEIARVEEIHRKFGDSRDPLGGLLGSMGNTINGGYQLGQL